MLRTQTVRAVCVGAFIVAASHVSAALNADDLVAAWLFEEGSGKTAVDATGNGHDGALVGNVEWAAGKNGGGVMFPGAGGTRVEVPHAASLLLGEWTIVAWAKLQPPPGGDWAVIVVKDPANGVQHYSLDLDGGGRAFAEVTAGGNWSDCGTISNAYDNVWHHLAASFDGSTLRVFFDGKMEKEQNFAQPDTNTAPVAIGGRMDNSQPLLGALDDVGIFGVALPEADIAALMNSGFEELLSVESTGKLATSWASLKRPTDPPAR
ncbi:MAG: LamG domain-containing protein [Candidatus Poribacteria bacterium]|nr:LamG domain-containing protein [Candidatus Poribacteria bacterium]